MVLDSFKIISKLFTGFFICTNPHASSLRISFTDTGPALMLFAGITKQERSFDRVELLSSRHNDDERCFPRIPDASNRPVIEHPTGNFLFNN